jgi:solute carrier family 25 protein 39/40
MDDDDDVGEGREKTREALSFLPPLHRCIHYRHTQKTSQHFSLSLSLKNDRDDYDRPLRLLSLNLHLSPAVSAYSASFHLDDPDPLRLVHQPPTIFSTRRHLYILAISTSSSPSTYNPRMAYIGSSAATQPATDFVHIYTPPSQPLDDTPAPAMDQETSIAQKMMSAVTGSILTSLLGIFTMSPTMFSLKTNNPLPVTPLDVVRVRLQSQSSPSPINASPAQPTFERLPPNLGISSCCREVYYVPNQSQYCIASSTSLTVDQMLISQCAAEESERRTFNSTIDGLKKIARNEGLTTLWRGLSPTLLMSVPANVIYFAGYDWLRANPNSPMKDRLPDNYAPLVAGASARILAAIAVSPVEMFRTRMQASNPQAATSTGVFRDTLSGLQDMVKVDGYRALWRGLTLTLWRDVPFSALYWWGYEYGRQTLHTAREGPASHEPTGSLENRSLTDLDHKTILVDSFIAGASAGAVAAFVTTPFDVAKTRRQVARPAIHSATAVVRPEDRMMPRFLWHIFKTEGAAGLFSGWAARTMKVAPACAIMISSYEIGKKMAGTMNEATVKK